MSTRLKPMEFHCIKTYKTWFINKNSIVRHNNTMKYYNYVPCTNKYFIL